MASFTKVGKRIRAQVRRRGFPSVAKTFATRKEAETWARAIEARIDAGKAETAASTMVVGDAVEEYKRMREEGGREIDPATNVAYMLKHLDDDLGHERIVDLAPGRLMQWAAKRKEEGAGPYTVNMELSCLGTMLRHVASFLNLQLPDVTGQARPLLLHMQLIGGGNRRTRRPTEDELSAVLAWVRERDPMAADAMQVAAITGLRRSELVRKLLWADIDEKQRAALIRARKHPRRHLARDEWVPLLGDAWDIVQRQARTVERVFPMSPEKITDLFTAARKACGIPDLRLHDLRHLASSRLQEMGFDDVERMAITGHRTVGMNARYTHPTPEHLHAKFDAALKPKDGPA